MIIIIIIIIIIMSVPRSLEEGEQVSLDDVGIEKEMEEVKIGGKKKSPVILGREFLRLQEERVKRYGILNQAHKTYLDSGPEYNIQEYQEKVEECTKEFRDISNKIIAAKKELEEEEKGDTMMAGMIGKVQEEEEKKLRMTVDHQLAMQQEKDNPGDKLQEENVRGIRKRLEAIQEEVRDVLEEVRYRIADLEEDENEEERPDK